LSLLALAVIVCIATFIGEAVGIAIAFHVSPLLVLGTIFDFDAGIRPGWQVLAAGLAVVVVDAVMARWKDRAMRTRAVTAG
jgi:sulfoxide reductase heme-binding subunit YedZ